jgi:hypothetical protein
LLQYRLRAAGMADLSYSKIKSASEAKAADEARAEKLRRDVIILIYGHLRTEGYHQTADRLEMGGSTRRPSISC